MKTMTVPLALAALALLPAEGRGQPVAPADRAPLNALVLEVRLLRQAIERQTASSVRSQLLASQLAVQHQRVVRAQDALDRAAEAVEAAARKQDQLRGSLARHNRVSADVIEEPRRSQLEREAETLRAQLLDQDRTVTRLTARHSQAEKSLSTEQRLYEDLESSLSSLDRQLQRPGP
jgi:chromosome segregation ATPase